MSTTTTSRVIVALDDMSVDSGYSLARRLSRRAWGFKANSMLDSVGSPSMITNQLGEHGNVFVDIKGYDIPSTITHRVDEHARNGAHLITLHASGGVEMLKAGVKAYKDFWNEDGMGILAVTVLTSMDDALCRQIYGTPVEETIDRFTAIAVDADVYGIICSPTDVARQRATWGDAIKYVCPGIRPVGSDADDQKRLATPEVAIKNGADFLVVGRPITGAQDPAAVLASINDEVEKALASH